MESEGMVLKDTWEYFRRFLSSSSFPSALPPDASRKEGLREEVTLEGREVVGCAGLSSIVPCHSTDMNVIKGRMLSAEKTWGKEEDEWNLNRILFLQNALRIDIYDGLGLTFS